MCIDCAECLEQINPACILPVDACIAGTTLATQVQAIATQLCNVNQQLVTINFGPSDCSPYKYEYTLTASGSNFIINIDFYAFNDFVSDVKTITITNNLGVIIATGATANFTLSQSLLLSGLTISIQFILNTGEVIAYQDVIILNGISELNKSYIKYLQCFNNNIVTLPIQTVLQNIIDRLNNL